MTANGYTVSSWDTGNVLKLGCGNSCTTSVSILKTIRCILLKGEIYYISVKLLFFKNGKKIKIRHETKKKINK